jgi:sulfur carrier protein ThiS
MVILKRKGETYTVPAGKRLEEALRELGILPETVLAIKDGGIVPLSHRLTEGEELELVDVISGG